MKQIFLKRFALKLSLAALLVLPTLASAQYFYSSDWGDVDAGFRKMGSNQEQYEMVAYLGNITNFLLVPAGASINITNYQAKQLTNMCPDNFGNLQWSVFSSFDSALGTFVTSLGTYPPGTCWYTIPRANANVQTSPVARNSYSISQSLSSSIYSITDGAQSTSTSLKTTNLNNNTFVVLEPVSLAASDDELTYLIGDPQNAAFGDFTGTIGYTVENVTSNSFSSPAVSDFYQVCPNTGPRPKPSEIYVDPITGLTNGVAYYVGYFTLNGNGSMTFTRATLVSPPSAGSVAGSATNGFSPLKVIFTNSASSGTITNWVWNFGNGTIITNTTGGNVTNTYSSGGNYTVTLTVYGTGGSSTVTLANYVVASPTPKLAAQALAGGKLVLGGTNGPAGVQYRILCSTNLALAVTNWIPVFTNMISTNGIYNYTNSATTNKSTFYRLISP